MEEDQKIERRFNPGEIIQTTVEGEKTLVEVIGSFKGEGEVVYSVKTSQGEILLRNEKNVAEKE